MLAIVKARCTSLTLGCTNNAIKYLQKNKCIFEDNKNNLSHYSTVNKFNKTNSKTFSNMRNSVNYCIKRRRYENECLSVKDDQNFHLNENHVITKINCGQLRREDVGKTVEIVGKVARQNLGKFIHLKDANGTTQLIVPECRTDLIRRFVNLPLNSHISVNGTVSHRPQFSKNEKMQTGDIEVIIDRFEVININRSLNLSEVHKIDARGYSTSAQLSVALTAEEYELCSGHKYYAEHLKLRSRTCGSINSHFNNQSIEVMGWVHQIDPPKFLHLRDGYGVVQCILSEDPELQSKIQDVKADTLIRVCGIVYPRPKSSVNISTQTGNIEILVRSLALIDPNVPPVDKETKRFEPATIQVHGVNSNCWRTHTCGELREHNAGERVTLCGWLEHHRMNKFFTLRDAYGSTQCIINGSQGTINAVNVKSLNLETVLEVEGSVAARPQSNLNHSMPTGGIEVIVDSVKVHNSATFHPFSIRSFQKAKESLRMQYRYLDLRFPEMQRNLRIRSDIILNMRKYLCDDHGFVEVETPTLFCRTPGGAQEFVVPTRHKGLFYSLVQSPQQFKQLLMVGSVDRYFQVARCYRDEDIRGDRQPEFTQLDIEMSFVGRDDVINLMEGLLRHCWPNELPQNIPRLTYKEVMEKFGTDKPDLNINCQFSNITQMIQQNEPSYSENNNFIGLAMLIPKARIGKSLKESLKTIFNKQSSKIKGFLKRVPVDWNAVGEFTNIMSFSHNVGQEILTRLNARPDDWLFMASGPWDETCLCMGEVRTLLGNHPDTISTVKTDTGCTKPLWVIDFPLFNKSDNGAHFESCHHPFTAPHPEDIHLLDTDPLKVRSLAYDLVIDGNEVGGGSIRAHNAELQKKLLEILNIPEMPLNHLLQALASGCPPHAGIALGLDRLITLACGAVSIRDVIAFPKSTEGRDLLSGAPSSISQHDKQIYHIDVVDK